MKYLLLAIAVSISKSSYAHSFDCSSSWFIDEEIKGGLNKIKTKTSSEIWLCGRFSGLWRYDGTKFSRILPELIKLGADAMDVTEGGDMWILAHEDLSGRKQAIYHLINGTTVHCVYEFESGWIKDIDMVDEDNGWAVGNYGAILRCTDHRWEKREESFQNFLVDVEMLDHSYGWMVGTEGLAACFNGDSWKIDNEGLNPIKFNSVSIVGKGDVWITGNGGVIAHLVDGKWRIVPSPTSSHLTSIKMLTEDTGWIGSMSGEILEYHEGGWHLCESPVRAMIKSIDTLGETTWLVTGEGDVIRNAEGGGARFVDMTQALGLSYRGRMTFPHVVDINNDGKPDIYVETNDKEDRLYLNSGTDSFTEVKATIARPPASHGTKEVSVAFGEFDGDGDMDCFLVDPYSNERYNLFLNDGSGHFHPRKGIVAQKNIPYIGPRQFFARFVDLEGAGKNSIFLTSSSQLEKNNRTSIWKTDGNLAPVEHPTSIGKSQHYLAFSFGDIDSDGDIDAVVVTSRDQCMISLYLNGGKGEFTSIPITGTNESSHCYDANSMELSDIDNDGKLDIILTDYGYGLKILMQEENLHFIDRTSEANIQSVPVIGRPFTPVVGDIDNDCDIDIVYTPRTVSGRDTVFIYLNDGRASFIDVSSTSNVRNISGCPVLFDFDEDGDLDLYVAAYVEHWKTVAGSKFFTNMHDAKDYIKVRVRGSSMNRYANGATVKLFDGDHPGDMNFYRGMRIVGGGNNLITQAPGEVHFGAPAGVYDIEVTFPGGKKVVEQGVHSGKTVTVYENRPLQRMLLSLHRSLYIIFAKEDKVALLFRILLLTIIILIVLKKIGSFLVTGKFRTITLLCLFPVFTVYLTYIWIDCAFFKRELLPYLSPLVFIAGVLCLEEIMKKMRGFKRIGTYVIMKKIGEGASAAIYKCKDTATGKMAALKVAHGFLMKSRTDRENFLREADFGTGLLHPNLATIYERGMEGETVYLAMEFIEGMTLSDYLERQKECSQDKTLHIAIQILSGLGCLHQSGIIHRDVKSDNIMMAESGVVKLMDYGLSKFLFRASATKSGAMLGTLRYMSPEQVLGKPIDVRTDLYSLGVVMYELLTKRLPFEGENELEVIHTILNENPPPLREVISTVSPFMEEIVMKALRRNPAERYRDADEMRADCELMRMLLRDERVMDDVEREMNGFRSMEDIPGINQLPVDTPVRGFLLSLGNYYLKLARNALEEGAESSSFLDYCGKALDYLDLTGERKLLVKAGFLMYRFYSLSGDQESGLLHMKESFEILEELLSEMNEDEKRMLINDEEISSLISEAEKHVDIE